MVQLTKTMRSAASGVPAPVHHPAPPARPRALCGFPDKRNCLDYFKDSLAEYSSVVDKEMSASSDRWVAFLVQLQQWHDYLVEEKATTLLALKIVGVPLAVVVLLDLLSRKEGDGELHVGPYLMVIAAPIILAILVVPFVEQLATKK